MVNATVIITDPQNHDLTIAMGSLFLVSRSFLTLKLCCRNDGSSWPIRGARTARRFVPDSSHGDQTRLLLLGIPSLNRIELLAGCHAQLAMFQIDVGVQTVLKPFCSITAVS